MKKIWIVRHEINGGEYVTTTKVIAKEIRAFNMKLENHDDSFVADGVTVMLGEAILDIVEEDI